MANYIQYFMSKKTSEQERKYSSYKLEVLAVVEALKKFQVYLLGKTFKIITDCAAFYIDEIIRNAHKRGHFATKRTKEDVKQEFFIPNLHSKVERCIANCVKCILINKKSGKQEGYLHPISKGNIPLHTYHLGHLGPLKMTHKNYRHILVIIDAFTKFMWLYPTKMVTSKETIKKLELQKSVFGNLSRIISDRGTAFTSAEFEDYCHNEDIEHIKVTVGLPMDKLRGSTG
ncbi:PREDICTED: uncharacterized protein LOC105453089 [Wasmannia auropunctata]|uniref:uncharacterized protein LOC105453089 n=1 Tax=Wasmannia auropunctata TaxID=64793 RepID=UPI0005EEAE0B|nr:PREDICTED: uncharacterized protein LOC105453089 [Wasmannia auropunctata]